MQLSTWIRLRCSKLTFRKMPHNRNYIVAAGFEDVLEFLTTFGFSPGDLAYLRERRLFSEEFLNRLEAVHFSGDVYAVPEGTLVFPHEPLLQVIAPILEAQLIETLVLNQIHFQSLAATKAARVVAAAKGRGVVDFGSRRAHGTDAAIKVARATYLSGGEGTSNVLAGQMFGIPVFGTMAHSYVQAHHDEAESFKTFARLYPDTTLLVDTYDTIAGVRKVIDLSREMNGPFRVRAVRLDSGDLAALADRARGMLDEAGLRNVTIFASGGLDEYKIQELVKAGAPIDAFGVGTRLAVIEDTPDLDMAYKLVEYAGKGTVKLSAEKVLYPGRKQVFRQVENGLMVRDVIGRFDEQLPGEPILKPLMTQGRQSVRTDLKESRERLRRELDRLPDQFRAIEPASEPYPVSLSERLQQDFEEVRHELASRH